MGTGTDFKWYQSAKLDTQSTMLLMQVLQGEETWDALTNPWGDQAQTIAKFRDGLVWYTAADSASGKNITRREFKAAFLGAIRFYAHRMADTIIKDIAAEYRKLGGQRAANVD